MRIAMLGTRGGPAADSGVETCVEQVGKRLAARGHEVIVYCRRGYGPTSPTRNYLGMRLVTLPSIKTKGLDTLSHTALSTIRALRRDRPDDALILRLGHGLI